MYGRYFILVERNSTGGFGDAWVVRIFSNSTTRDKMTYDRKRVIKRKSEPADAYHSDVGCQECDGCKEVKERGVCPEALQGNVSVSHAQRVKLTPMGAGGGGGGSVQFGNCKQRRTMHFAPNQGQW